MKKNNNYLTNVVEELNIESNIENNISKLYEQIISYILQTPKRYQKSSFIMLMMKTEPGALSFENISIGLTKLEFDFPNIDSISDDCYLDAAYYYGRKVAHEFYNMGFPMHSMKISDYENVENYTGPISIGIITPEPDGLTIIFRSFDNIYLLNNSFSAFKVVFDTSRISFSFNITSVYKFPDWITEISAAICDYCCVEEYLNDHNY